MHDRNSTKLKFSPLRHRYPPSTYTSVTTVFTSNNSRKPKRISQNKQIVINRFDFRIYQISNIMLDLHIHCKPFFDSLHKTKIKDAHNTKMPDKEVQHSIREISSNPVSFLRAFSSTSLTVSQTHSIRQTTHFHQVLLQYEADDCISPHVQNGSAHQF